MSKKTVTVKYFVKPLAALAALAGLWKSFTAIKSHRAQKSIEQ